MSFINDKLYNGYLRQNMGAIVSKVKVREIIIHLPCLTPHDQETIEAKREMCGNYNSMVLLLDCLKRRENWPQQFIDALEACEQTTLAAEIRAEYNMLRGNPPPSSPPTSVVSAHVHPAPPAGRLPIPESGASSQAAVAPPAELDARASAPLETPVQPQVPEAVSPPEPVPEPPQSTQVEVAARPPTPPASPESPHTPATTSSAPEREITSQQEPEENSESDIQDISGGDGVIPDWESAENSEVSIDHVAEPQPTPCKTDTSERPPVQDTTPPAVVLQLEETSEPPFTQTETTATTSPLPGASGIDASLRDDNEVYLSKPGQLISINPPNNGSPTVVAPSAPVQPYSGDSGRLEVSDSVPDTVTSTQPPSCSAFSSTTVSTASALPCQENGISLNHNEPEENHYESPCRGLEMHRVLTHVVHVSEEPSILDLDGQSPKQARFYNGEATKESVNTPSSEDRPPSEPAPADISPESVTLQDSEKKTTSRTPPANTKYILSAAGVGVCALLLAWRLRK
uniref:Mitochondrial antiviral-signaling protein n=1 Tax=Cyclopterus lumpus TaxID=8103 RepID=A0A8C3G310_CYCLU